MRERPPFPWRWWYKSVQPDELVRTLDETECPPLLALRGVQQERAHHPEGDAYEHTLQHCVVSEHKAVQALREVRAVLDRAGV